MEQVKKDRSCGGCTACCFTHAIEFFDKPPAQLCIKCAEGKGCSIYGAHPVECERYRCLWLMADFPEDMRPDRLGVVADFIPEKHTKVKFEVMRLWEVRPGALDSAEAQVLLQGLFTTKVFIMRRRLQAGGGYVDDYLASPLLEKEKVLTK